MQAAQIFCSARRFGRRLHACAQGGGSPPRKDEQVLGRPLRLLFVVVTLRLALLFGPGTSAVWRTRLDELVRALVVNDTGASGPAVFRVKVSSTILPLSVDDIAVVSPAEYAPHVPCARV